MTTVGQVEIEPFARRVLERHWPMVPRHDDVRTAIEWWDSAPRPNVDLICGGFPCQDISSANTAGPRAGLAGIKSGLWGAYRDILEHLRPRWTVIENSPRWRTWAPTVRQDLEQLGMRSVALQLSAGTFGAPHRRPRCVVVANSNSDGESLRALYAKVAELEALPRRSDAPTVPRTVGMGDGVPGRMDRLRALGNAVHPGVSEWVGARVMQIDLEVCDAG